MPLLHRISFQLIDEPASLKALYGKSPTAADKASFKQLTTFLQENNPGFIWYPFNRLFDNSTVYGIKFHDLEERRLFFVHHHPSNRLVILYCAPTDPSEHHANCHLKKLEKVKDSLGSDFNINDLQPVENARRSSSETEDIVEISLEEEVSITPIKPDTELSGSLIKDFVHDVVKVISASPAVQQAIVDNFRQLLMRKNFAGYFKRQDGRLFYCYRIGKSQFRQVPLETRVKSHLIEYLFNLLALDLSQIDEEDAAGQACKVAFKNMTALSVSVYPEILNEFVYSFSKVKLSLDNDGINQYFDSVYGEVEGKKLNQSDLVGVHGLLVEDEKILHLSVKNKSRLLNALVDQQFHHQALQDEKEWKNLSKLLLQSTRDSQCYFLARTPAGHLEKVVEIIKKSGDLDVCVRGVCQRKLNSKLDSIGNAFTSVINNIYNAYEGLDPQSKEALRSSISQYANELKGTPFQAELAADAAQVAAQRAPVPVAPPAANVKKNKKKKNNRKTVAAPAAPALPPMPPLKDEVEAPLIALEELWNTPTQKPEVVWKFYNDLIDVMARVYYRGGYIAANDATMNRFMNFLLLSYTEVLSENYAIQQDARTPFGMYVKYEMSLLRMFTMCSILKNHNPSAMAILATNALSEVIQSPNKVKMLLSFGASLSSNTLFRGQADGMPPLFLAICHAGNHPEDVNGALASFKILLREGADITELDEHGNNILTFALSRYSKIEFIELLIAYKVNVHLSSPLAHGSRVTALDLARGLHDQKAGDLLEAEGAKLCFGPIMSGIPKEDTPNSGAVPFTSILLSRGTPVIIESMELYKNWMLTLQSLKGCSDFKSNEVLKGIIQSKYFAVDMQGGYQDNLTGMQCMVQCGNCDGVQFLLDLGADPNIRIWKQFEIIRPDGKSQITRYYTQLEMIENIASPNGMRLAFLLIDFGAKLDVLGVDGQTFLHRCVMKKVLPAIKRLVALDRNLLNIKNRDGRTPAEVATDPNVRQFLQMYLFYSTQVSTVFTTKADAANPLTNIPMLNTIKSDDVYQFSSSLSNLPTGVDRQFYVNQPHPDTQDTLLHYACLWHAYHVIVLLLERFNMDVTKKNDQGHTPVTLFLTADFRQRLAKETRSPAFVKAYKALSDRFNASKASQPSAAAP